MSTNQQLIWLIDDDTEDQFLFQRAFHTVNPGVEIKPLDDGDEVVPALIQSELLPTLIILDLNMARMGGFETLNALQELPSLRTVPVVIVTTSNSPKDKALSQELGARDFFCKPFHYQGILDLVGQLSSRWLA